LHSDKMTLITILSSYVSVAGFALDLSRRSDLAFGVGVAAFIFVFFLLVKSAKNRAKAKTITRRLTVKSTP